MIYKSTYNIVTYLSLEKNTFPIIFSKIISYLFSSPFWFCRIFSILFCFCYTLRWFDSSKLFNNLGAKMYNHIRLDKGGVAGRGVKELSKRLRTNCSSKFALSLCFFFGIFFDYIFLLEIPFQLYYSLIDFRFICFC